MFDDNIDVDNKSSLSVLMDKMMYNGIVLDHKNPWNTLNNNSYFFPFQIKKEVTKTFENGVE